MPAPVSPSEIRAWIEKSLGQRPDFGFWKAVVNMSFEAPSPFDPRARRKPKIGFLIGAMLFAVAVGCFCYFNVAR